MSKLLLENKLREFEASTKFCYFDIITVYERYKENQNNLFTFNTKYKAICRGLIEKGVLK